MQKPSVTRVGMIPLFPLFLPHLMLCEVFPRPHLQPVLSCMPHAHRPHSWSFNSQAFSPSGPLQLLFPPPGTLFPLISHGSPFSSFRTQPAWHVLRKALQATQDETVAPTPLSSHPLFCFLSCLFHNLKCSVSLFV